MSVHEPVFDEIVAQVQQLSTRDQLRLIKHLTEGLISVVPTSLDRSVKQQRQSVVEILSLAPGHRLFKTQEEVEQYLAEERATWDN